MWKTINEQLKHLASCSIVYFWHHKIFSNVFEVYLKHSIKVGMLNVQWHVHGIILLSTMICLKDLKSNFKLQIEKIFQIMCKLRRLGSCKIRNINRWAMIRSFYCNWAADTCIQIHFLMIQIGREFWNMPWKQELPSLNFAVKKKKKKRSWYKSSFSYCTQKASFLPETFICP